MVTKKIRDETFETVLRYGVVHQIKNNGDEVCVCTVCGDERNRDSEILQHIKNLHMDDELPDRTNGTIME